MTTWHSSVSRLREIPAVTNERKSPAIYQLRKGQWRQAYHLDRASLHTDLNWPDPIPDDTYRTGLWRTISNFLNGRQVETWTTMTKEERLIGMSSIFNEWGRAYTINVRVHPDWQGQVERPLFAKLTRRLRTMSRRNIQINHLEQDELMNQLLQEANFSVRRTLTYMRLDI